MALGWSLPERYGLSELYLRLRVCERFGCWPLGPGGGPGGGLASLADAPPETLATLYAYERVRGAEEARIATAGVGAALGRA